MEDSILKRGIIEHLDAAKLLLEDEATLKLIEKAAEKIAESYKRGGKTIFMGNGGSAADAQHMAAEFLGRYMLERKALPSIALTANSSAMTAIGNDYGYEKTFARQVEAWGGQNDIAIGISTSGNSPNVVEAIRYAKSKGIFTIALTGNKKCKLDSIADLCIKAPGSSTPRIQEMHTLILHMICEIVEKRLFG